MRLEDLAILATAGNPIPAGFHFSVVPSFKPNHICVSLILSTDNVYKHAVRHVEDDLCQSDGQLLARTVQAIQDCIKELQR